MAQTTATGPNVQEMVLVHRMFEREYGLAPTLVRAVDVGDTKRAAVVTTHLNEVATMLHHHHLGEDELVWPRLTGRAPVSADLVRRMEEQHAHVGALLEQVQELLPAWAGEPGQPQRDELAAVLDALAPALERHLYEEERDVLPLIEQHLTVGEWNELGEHAVAAIPKVRLLVLLGYILEGTTPDEQRTMLRVVPPPARLLYKVLGRFRHAQERKRIRRGAVPEQRRPHV